MTENLTTTPNELEPPLVSDEAAAQWVGDMPHTSYGTEIMYDRGEGLERFTLDDALTIRVDPSDQNNRQTFPGLVLTAADGQRITVNARDYLQQTGFDGEAYLEHKAAERQLAAEQRAEQSQAEIERAKVLQEARWAAFLEREKPYYAALFAPIEPPKHGDKDNFDSKTGRTTYSPTTYYRYVNDVNRADSAELLTETLQHDEGLFDIVASFGEQVDLSSAPSVVDAIRTNPELRMAVGIYYVDKIHRQVKANPWAFGEQVRDNTTKNLEMMSHVTSARSRDNVALICLAKLDGSFAGRNPITKEKIDSASLGTHHRPAADYVIAA